MSETRQGEDRIRAAQFIPGMDTVPELNWLSTAFAASRRHVEIGCFCGKSLFVSTGSMVAGEVIAVDTLTLGTIVEPAPEWVRTILGMTIDAIRQLNEGLTVEFIHGDSMEAAKRTTGLVDSVYIDANHSYASVMRDIQVWRPRVRSGGIMAGHDYCGSFPGVMRAVQDEFGTSFRHVPKTRIWWHQKE